jgi:BTB/POZ domain
MSTLLVVNEETVFHLEIGGKIFVLDADDIKTFQSDFLSTLVSENSPFRKPDNGMYVVDANAQWFSAFLHLTRFNTFPVEYNYIKNISDEYLSNALSEADFWGIKDRVSREIATLSNMMGDIRNEAHREGHRQGTSHGIEIRDLKQNVRESGKHHNYRRNDCNGRVYCTECSHRDLDGANKYATCTKCHSQFYYKVDLNWCHKCKLCQRCQAYECPADQMISYRWGQYTKSSTTAERKAELAKADCPY